MTSTEIPDFVSTQWIADLFDVTRETVRNWIKEGKFPNANRVGRKWLIPRRDIQELLDARFGPKEVMQ